MGNEQMLQRTTSFFRLNFRTEKDLRTGDPRWVGLENEYPMVSADGTMMQPETLTSLWQDLSTCGWERLGEPKTTGVRKNREDLKTKKKHSYDLITTDLGYATLEIDLAPAPSLHEAYEHLSRLMNMLTSILKKHNTYLLGYGVQPVTSPSPAYVGPKRRYPLMIDICDEENAHDEGAFHADLHTLDAACQTQVEVSSYEAIPMVNALNATAGLRIALLANSSVWQNQLAEYKAIRQMFIDWCWPSRKAQLGIPPSFHNIEHYINYLLDFRSLMVERNHTFYRLNNQRTFRQFFTDECGEHGVTPDGDGTRVFARVEDILSQSGLAWFCARLQPAYGTVEDRVSCQQPPQSPLCASALTLGLVENYHPLIKMAEAYSLDQWRAIRLLTARLALDCSYSDISLKEMLAQMLSIAEQGLRQRGFGEEIYLEPLYQRLANNRCPADEVRSQFLDGGIEKIVSCNDMRKIFSSSL